MILNPQDVRSWIKSAKFSYQTLWSVFFLGFDTLVLNTVALKGTHIPLMKKWRRL